MFFRILFQSAVSIACTGSSCDLSAQPEPCRDQMNITRYRHSTCSLSMISRLYSCVWLVYLSSVFSVVYCFCFYSFQVISVYCVPLPTMRVEHSRGVAIVLLNPVDELGPSNALRKRLVVGGVARMTEDCGRGRGQGLVLADVLAGTYCSY